MAQSLLIYRINPGLPGIRSVFTRIPALCHRQLALRLNILKMAYWTGILTDLLHRGVDRCQPPMRLERGSTISFIPFR